jgi:uncharacterized membrane protein (DUF373 family)
MEPEVSRPGPQWWRFLAEHWPSLTWYQRFESLVALTLTLVVSVVILVALYRLIVEVASSLVIGALDPLDHSVFQTVFGQIITLMIALEFNHTLLYFVTRVQSVIQTKIVLLIATLAMARKFIILDMRATRPAELLSLAAATLALGIAYALIRHRVAGRESG